MGEGKEANSKSLFLKIILFRFMQMRFHSKTQRVLSFPQEFLNLNSFLFILFFAFLFPGPRRGVIFQFPAKSVTSPWNTDDVNSLLIRDTIREQKICIYAS